MGLNFYSPVLLAAGFDKGAEAYNAFSAMGFGAVEVGTITGLPQEGNALPRVFRLPNDKCLLNRMGFNNCGSKAAVARLTGPRLGVVGVNIGKTKRVAEDAAVEDYVQSTHLLGPLADYFVVNVSSPNTPGLRDLQAVSKLRPLLEAVQLELSRTCGEDAPPLLVKIAPDLENDAIVEVADLAIELGLAGIVATNTTLSRNLLTGPSSWIESLGPGGVSGPVLEARSLEVLKLLRTRVGSKLTLVAAGGIGSAEAAWERIVAGASLVQIYTAFVYAGPRLPSEIAQGMLRLAEKSGFGSLNEAVAHYSAQ